MAEEKWVYEKATGWYYATFKDRNKSIIGRSNVASMVVKVYDERTNTLLSSTDAYDFGDWGANVSLSTASYQNLVITLSTADNTIVGNNYMGTSGPFTYEDEIHVILVDGQTAGSPQSTFKIQYKYKVKNLRKV